MACDFVITMLRLQKLYLIFFFLNLLDVAILMEENITETRKAEPEGPMTAIKNVTYQPQTWSWPLSSEESHRQGVIGEYADLPDSEEVSLLDPDDKGQTITRPTQKSAEGPTSKRTTQTQSVQELPTTINQSTREKNVHQPPLHLDQETNLPVPPGQANRSGHPTPTADTETWTTSPFSERKQQSGTVAVDKETGKSFSVTENYRFHHQKKMSVTEDLSSFSHASHKPSFSHHLEQTERSAPHALLAVQTKPHDHTHTCQSK